MLYNLKGNRNTARWASWHFVPFSIISNKPATTTEEFDAFHGFMLIKI